MRIRIVAACAALLAVTFGTMKASGQAIPKEEVSLSAPLLPDMVRMQYQYGAKYPTTQVDKEKIVDDELYVFEKLLTDCKPKYPKITLKQQGQAALTPGELQTNYEQVAICSYKEYGAKPYMIPQLVDDVDICGRKLGKDWRLPTEQDLQTLDEADFDFIADQLTAAGGATIGQGGWSFSEFYFSLRVYLRGNDGTLKMGVFEKGEKQRVQPLPPTDDGTPKGLLMSYGASNSVVVRCVKRIAAN